jgi:hypothetical protein
MTNVSIRRGLRRQPSRRAPCSEAGPSIKPGGTHGEARLQADDGAARTDRPRPQRQAGRTGRLRLRGHLRPLLSLARGTGSCAVRLVGAGRGRRGDKAPWPDDGGDLPDHALSPGDHRPGDGDHGPSGQGPFHPRSRRGRASQRACRRLWLAGRGRAPRAAVRSPRYHPGPAGRRAHDLPRQTFPTRSRQAVRPSQAQAAGHHGGGRSGRL